MKEFKYTIEGKEYEVTIAAIDENNVADITVNGESYKVQIEKEAEPETGHRSRGSFCDRGYSGLSRSPGGSD